MTDPAPDGNITETVRDIAHTAGASLASMEYEVHIPAGISALKLADGRVVGAEPSPNYPSLHLIPDSPAATEFWAQITRYTDDADDFVLLEEAPHERRFTIQGHETEVTLRETWSTREAETLVTWEISWT